MSTFEQPKGSELSAWVLWAETGNWGIPRDLPREWPANLLHLVRIYAVCKLALETLQNNKPHKSVPVFGRRQMIMFARIHFAEEILSADQDEEIFSLSMILYSISW